MTTVACMDGWVSGAFAQAAGAAPGALPPYESVVTAVMLKGSVWVPGSLAGRVPPFDRDRTYSSVELEVVSWRPIAEKQDELLHVGQRLEAFCEGRLPEATGQTATVRLRFTGDTRGVRWELSDPAAAPAPNDPDAPAGRVRRCPGGSGSARTPRP